MRTYDRLVLRDFPVPILAAAGRSGVATTPRDAATVLLLRDGPGGPEVFVLRRVPTMAFAPSMHVFPGGGVDPRDGERALAWTGPDAGWWGQALGCPPAQARRLLCAAVRELFEETGVLLAGGSPDDAAADEADRLRLLGRGQSLAQLLTRRGLPLRADLLRPWARWVTPEHEPRRFDARFLVAPLPPGHTARDVGGEADRAVWVAATRAVAEHHAGRMAMLPPTLVALEEVAAHPDVASVLAEPRTVRPVMPWPHGGGLRVDLDGIGGGEPARLVP